MKSIFKIALLGLLLLPASAIFAQPPKDDGQITDSEKQEWKQRAEMRHKKHMEKLSKELNLGTEQEQKVSQILKEGWEKISAERDKMRQTVRSIREETDRQIEKLLSPEQVEKFRQHREKMKKKFREKAKKWKRHISEPE